MGYRASSGGKRQTVAEGVLAQPIRDQGIHCEEDGMGDGNGLDEREVLTAAKANEKKSQTKRLYRQGVTTNGVWILR